MGFFDNLYNRCKNARVHIERANNPDTHLPYRKPSWKDKALYAMVTAPPTERRIYKWLAAISGGLGIWLTTKLSGITNMDSTAGAELMLGIVLTAKGFVWFIYEQILSALATRAGQNSPGLNPEYTTMTAPSLPAASIPLQPRFSHAREAMGLTPVAPVPPAPLPAPSPPPTYFLGIKGQFIIALKPVGDDFEIIRGRLMGEIDTHVIIELPDGNVLTLVREDYEFYLKA